MAIIADSYKSLTAGNAGPSSSAISSMAAKLKSTSTLGQFPTNPLSAQERVDKREDLDVRRAMQKTAQRNGITYDDSDPEDLDRDMRATGPQDVSRWRQAKRMKKSEKNGRVIDAEGLDVIDDISLANSKNTHKQVKRAKTRKVSIGSEVIDGKHL
jgi:hypothetical protein